MSTKPTRRVLHVLSQRPSRTGSGITLDCLVREAARQGWEQRVLAGVPEEDPTPEVGGLDARHIQTLRFGGARLPFAVPGMSDVMPYTSTRFSAMTPAQLAAYRQAFGARLSQTVEEFQPDLIHVHHLWIVASLIKDLAPQIPVVNHCHATGLRQMRLCPALADQVRKGCARNEAFVALHREQAKQLSEALGVNLGRVQVVGAGYREDLFHLPEASDEHATHNHRPQHPPTELRSTPDATPGAALETTAMTSTRPRAKVIAYAGKMAEAKGLGPLLNAFAALRRDDSQLELWLFGPAAGDEGEALERKAAALDGVRLFGPRPPAELAEHLRRAGVFALPSMYEGLPLVLVEAAACGCRLVATALPGIVEALAPALGDRLRLVETPRLLGVDRLHPEDMDAFTADLRDTLARSLADTDKANHAKANNAGAIEAANLASFTWASVFSRVQAVWEGAIEAGPRREPTG